MSSLPERLKPWASLIGTVIHVLMPLVVVGIALWAQFHGAPFDTGQLIILISASYGKTIFHDFLQAKMMLFSKTETKAETITRTIKEGFDVEKGYQPTKA